MSKTHIPLRKDVPAKDKWDLSTLFKSDDDWEKALTSILPMAEEIENCKGKVGQSADTFLHTLSLLSKMEQTSEIVGSYAFLLSAGDAGDSANQEKKSRYLMAATAAEAKISFLIPEIQSIDEESVRQWIATPAFDDYRVWVTKLLRMKNHILSEKEEKILALQNESSQTPDKAFSMLTDVDMDFGTITTPEGEIPLTHSTFSLLLQNQDIEIRKKTYQQFYGVFEKHKNTIATLYEGSVNQDIFEARVREYKSAREKALYPDKVPLSVYDNLIKAVRESLPVVHRYYELRRKVLKLDTLHHYDVYVPLVHSVKKHTSYEEAVEIIRNALAPLGQEYVNTLCTGLVNGWVDRYENKGKDSGAFSAGSYTGYPYILLNYKEDVLRDVYTMAHEGGHSMHSHYSSSSNPFMQYNYTIFEAEVASTFNEQLVFQYLLKNADSKEMKAYLLSERASDILATLYRQTMFAEFELKTHEFVESGTPLTVDLLRSTYRKLLEDYFGPKVELLEMSDLEGLRIPHFYRAFYVYKYATGISASLALAKRVTEGGEKEKEDYFTFLKSGGSRYPIEALKVAGVDMESPEPVRSALKTFENLVDELESLLL